MVRRDWCAGGDPTATIVLPGRVLWVRALASSPSGVVHILHVRNVGVRAADLLAIRDIVERATLAGELLLVTGGFNFGLTGEDGLVTSDVGGVNTFAHSRERDRWAVSLRQVTPAHHGQATRAALEHHEFGHTSVAHSSLDRACTKLAPESMQHLDLFVQVSDIALAIHSASHAPLSDHIHVAIVVRPRDSLPAHRRPIPRWVTLSGEFAARARAAIEAAIHEGLHPHDAWRRAKQALRKAAAAARDELLRRGSSPQARCQLALQASRAVHANNCWLMRKVLHECSGRGVSDCGARFSVDAAPLWGGDCSCCTTGASCRGCGGRARCCEAASPSQPCENGGGAVDQALGPPRSASMDGRRALRGRGLGRGSRRS